VPYLTLRRKNPVRGLAPRAQRERLQGVAFWLVFGVVVALVCVLVPTQA
jgi:hypothetical protein